MNNIYNRALLRFLRGGLAGAFATMVMILPMNTSKWSDLWFWIQALVLSGLFGFISGGVLAIDKFLRDKSSK